jgi:hypothetical protein
MATETHATGTAETPQELWATLLIALSIDKSHGRQHVHPISTLHPTTIVNFSLLDGTSSVLGAHKILMPKMLNVILRQGQQTLNRRSQKNTGRRDGEARASGESTRRMGTALFGCQVRTVTISINSLRWNLFFSF